ncbi:MAG: tripartite tricarboxylate transporter substrate-binding protein [Burkholderiaceae bacterium]
MNRLDTTRRRLIAAAAAGFTLGSARAQSWPSRPIRLLVGFAAGGGADAMARLLASRLAETIGQQVVVENRAGASGLIAADAVARAAPDGYTLFFADTSLLIARSFGNAQAPDPVRAFTPVALAFRAPLMIVAHPSFPATDPVSLVRALKAAPGRYAYATSGIGTVHHLGFETLKARTGSFVVHIPYRGASQILPDVAGAQVPLGVVSAAAGLSQARAGRVKALAMMSPDRLPGVEGVVAPLADAVPGFDVAPSLFVLAPAGLPADIASKLGDAVRTALGNPATEQAAASQGAVRTYGDAAALQAAMAKESDLFARVIRDQKLSPEGG